MRLIISDIQYDDDSIIIYGITNIGIVKGIWKSKERPILCKHYSVEMDYREFERQISIEQSQNVYTEICQIDNTVHFCGKCEDMDEDVYYIRFAVDWLDMVEIPEGEVELKQGDFVSFSVKFDSIWIYPY